MSAPDPNIAQRNASDPKQSVWVGASAGSGKTKVLTDRVLSLLLDGAEPSRLLCLTFTKAAAAEMANRVNDRLARWAAMDDSSLAADLSALLGRRPKGRETARARVLFARVLDAPGGMRIETIHAFCQALLRRFPLEAGLAPHFRVMDERDATELLIAAREETLKSAYRNQDSPLGAAIDYLAGAVHESGLNSLLESLLAERGRLIRLKRHFDGVERAAAALAAGLGVSPDERRENSLEAACGDESLDREGLAQVARLMLENKGKESLKSGALMADWLADVENRVKNYPRWKSVFFTQKGELRKNPVAKPVLAAFPQAEEIMGKEAGRLIRLEDRLRALAAVEDSRAMMIAADDLLNRYEAGKSTRALLDYDDLILLSRALLEKDGGAAWVLYKLDGGVDHILIDEAQDTNPDQWAVVRSLTDEFFSGRGRFEEGRRTVFAVGDVKQSIYSFQRADPERFEIMRALYASRIPAAHGRWEEVDLTMSFRSTRAVLKAVDLTFNHPDGQDGVVQPGQTLRHDAFRDKDGGSVSLWPLVEPLPADAPPAWKPPVERLRGDNPPQRLARLIAGRIRAMLENERLLSRNRLITPGDIMILVRRRDEFFIEMVRALKEAGVPVAGADRMVLSEQMAVMDLMALGQTLLLPEDDLTLATVLKGPLIGLSEQDLFDLAWGRKGRLIDALAEKRRDAPYEGAFALLKEWGRLARRLPVHEFYAAILNDGGKAALLARLGVEAEDPLEEFMSLTLSFEQGRAPSLQNFLAWLQSGEAEVKRDLEAGGNMVRIMTVHGAKGLQAPVVFLPDTARPPATRATLLWLQADGVDLPIRQIKREQAPMLVNELADRAALARDREYRRLFYVAMTRAEDHLVICGWRRKSQSPANSWHNLAQAALSPDLKTDENPALPGLFDAAGIEGEARVMVCAQEREPDAAAAERLASTGVALPDWARRKPEKEEPLTRPLSPSSPRREEPAIRSPLDFSREEKGPALLRGRLVHALLQNLPDLPAARRQAEGFRYLSRRGVPPEAGEEIMEKVMAILDHPDWRDLFGPDSQAEIPVVGRIGARAASGRIDRLLATKEEILAIDYKTDRRAPRNESEIDPLYLEQLAAYRALLQDIYPGKTVRCGFIWTDGPRLTPVSAEALDRALERLEENWR